MLRRVPNRVAAKLDIAYLKATDWWSRVDTSNDGCWLWKQSVGSHGYGQTWDGISVRLAHRVAWELSNGPIPKGMTVDHICRVRRCCNPLHLRLLSNEENGADNGNKRKTHCPQGHPYAGENLYVAPKGDRRCRICIRERYL